MTLSEHVQLMFLIKGYQLVIRKFKMAPIY